MSIKYVKNISKMLAIFSLCFFPMKNIKAATILDFIVPENFRFNKDFSYGTTTTPDVRYLQNILNMSTSTKVSSTGVGSGFNLTNYYGAKTKNAVNRFQQVFADDIAYERSISTSTDALTVAISSSTVDVFTRAVLNKLIIIYSDDRNRYIEYLQTGTTTETGAEELPAAEAPSGGSSGSGTSGGSGNSNNSSGGIEQPHEHIYKTKKMLFTYSPRGQILKAIGGQKLVDSVFSYTPAGLVGKLSGADGGSSGSSNSSGAGIAGIAGGAAAGGSGAVQAELLNFGGITTAMVDCSCSGNILLYVADVRKVTLPLMYQPGVTLLYELYRPTSGVNVLGQYVTGGQCMIPSVTGCVTGGTPVGTMVQLGTSLSIGK